VLCKCSEPDLRWWANGLGANTRYTKVTPAASREEGVENNAMLEQCMAASFGISVPDLEKVVVLFAEKIKPKMTVRDCAPGHNWLFPRSKLRGKKQRRCFQCESSPFGESATLPSDAELGIEFATEADCLAERFRGKEARSASKVHRLQAARRGEWEAPRDTHSSRGACPPHILAMYADAYGHLYDAQGVRK
jgi:hypothetical protein